MGTQVFKQRIYRSGQFAVSALGLVVAVTVGSAVRAQEAAPAAEPAPQVQVQVQQASAPAEEVIVTGQRTFQSLINEAARETENFYSRLNLVLDRPEFQITCRSEARGGSNIRSRVCRMRYQEDLDSRAALSAIQGTQSIQDADGNVTGSVFNGTPYDVNPEARRMNQEFEVALLEAVNTDPELNASVVRLLQLKAAVDNYESDRQERRQ